MSIKFSRNDESLDPSAFFRRLSADVAEGKCSEVQDELRKLSCAEHGTSAEKLILQMRGAKGRLAFDACCEAFHSHIVETASTHGVAIVFDKATTS